jgi:4-amino-4-deoxy-L-arabinose transferase-like glycosyltransferase
MKSRENGRLGLGQAAFANTAALLHVLGLARHAAGRLAVFAVFLLVLAMRLPHLGDSPSGYDAWRQSDTEAMARNFAEHRFNILYPQLNYQGPPPNYAQLELQVTTWTIAVLYRLFGYHYELARMVPIGFFIGSALFVYKIALLRASRHTACLAVLLYGLFPLNVLYSRAIMPESAALFFYTGAYYWFSLWIVKEERRLLLAAALFTALAIGVKVPAVFVGVPMAAMAYAKYGLSLLRKLELWLFALLSLAPPAVYYAWLGTVAESDFVSGIAVKHIFPKMAAAWAAPEAMAFFARELPKAFTWTGLALVLVGAVAVIRRKQWAEAVWALAVLAEWAMIVAVIRFNYYLIFAGPVMALFAAAAPAMSAGKADAGRNRFSARDLAAHFRTASVQPIARFAAQLAPIKRKAALGLIALIIGICACESYFSVKPLYAFQDRELIAQAELVQRLTAPDDLIVTGLDDPSLLNASRRAGWRVTNSIPGDPVGELYDFLSQGAAYFVPMKGYIDGDPEGRLKKILDERFPKLGDENGYFLYKLKP